jgi:hypothetical protein
MTPDEHIADLALKLAGNHTRFESFGLHGDRPEDFDTNWAIVYTSNRDSGALERSNARVIAAALAPFEDAVSCSHGHWAVGHVDGYEICVYDARGNITEAFRAYAELALAIEEYPILDESDFSEEEETEANETWKHCYKPSTRLDYIREHREQFEFRSFADMLGSVRGNYFGGYASELIG